MQIDLDLECLDRVDLDLEDLLVDSVPLEVEIDLVNKKGIAVSCSEVVTNMALPSFMA